MVNAQAWADRRAGRRNHHLLLPPFLSHPSNHVLAIALFLAPTLVLVLALALAPIALVLAIALALMLMMLISCCLCDGVTCFLGTVAMVLAVIVCVVQGHLWHL